MKALYYIQIVLTFAIIIAGYLAYQEVVTFSEQIRQQQQIDSLYYTK
jgi:hypothetical protein